MGTVRGLRQDLGRACDDERCTAHMQTPPEHLESWQPSPGFDGPPTAPGRNGLLHGPGLNCSSFETPWCNLEFNEWSMARAQILPNDTVIEFGARYGTTSCAIADALGNSGRLVSVEPDARVYSALLRNRNRNHCNFHALLGVVSSEPLELRRLRIHGHDQLSTNGYDQTTRPARSASATLPGFKFQELEAKIGSRFTAALVDCEGCLRSVWDTGLIHQLRLLILEEDGNPRLYPRLWHPRFQQIGFVRVWNAYDRRSGNHSAWVRANSTSLRVSPSCLQYRQRWLKKQSYLYCRE